MAPTSQTPTPTTANKMARRAPTPTTSTPPLDRRRGNMNMPQRDAASVEASVDIPDGDVDVVMTPGRRGVGQAVDELPGSRSFEDLERQDAFESARKKFAMYGKQNEHVSHYSPEGIKERASQRKARRKGGSVSAAAAGPPPARRTVAWEDDAETANAVVLKNALLLQENGELAAQVDEIEYHLDGIGTGAHASIGVDSERGYAMAQSVVALTRLLQEDRVQAVMKVASPSRQLYARLRGVVSTLETTSHRMLTLAIAVMAYTLTYSADADEYFQEPVIDAVVACLESEAKRLGVNEQQAPQQRDGDGNGANAKTSVKKSSLRRKKSTGTLGRALSTGGDAVSGTDHDEGAKANMSRSQALRDEKIQADLRDLLRGNDVFAVDGSVQLSLGDVLCMILHNILQIGGAAMNASHAESTERAIVKPSGPQHVRRLHQRQDQAGTMFATILQRKKLLLRNRGLDVLLTLLANRIDRLQGNLDNDLLHASVSLDLVSAFQRMRTILHVLDQASFLAHDVQVHMSKDSMVFRTTLKLVEALSRLAWSHKSRRKWQSDPGFMHLVVDVLLAALRVLINLSHHNEDASRHIAEFEGMRVLFFAFCSLWGSSELEEGAVNRSNESEDKVVYDALLLILSAITNCVEYSEENRALLSQIDLSKAALDGLEAFKASSVCTLLTAFFVSKVKSYVHLIEMSESQRELEEETWVPEDVILGGCTSLLLGCLMKDSSYDSAIILGALPDGSPRLLLRALSAFVALHSQIGALTPEVGKSVLEVEQVLKSFSFDRDETMLASSAAALGARGRLIEGDSSSSSTVSRSCPVPSSDEYIPHTADATLTIKVTMTPQRRRVREADVEEIVEDGGESMEESQPSQPSQQSVRSPPPSAFKLQRFKRICSAVDDSDDVASDVDPSPVKKKRSVPTPKSQSKAGRGKILVSTNVTATPIRPQSEGPNNRDVANQKVKSPMQHRLKRSRQLVSDLEAEFMKIGTQVSSDVNTSGAMTSSEDAGDGLDFSHDLSTSVIYVVKPKLARATPKKKPKRAVAATPAPVVSAPRLQTPPTTHKRKTKSTPPSAVKKPAAKSTTSLSVFDFPG